MISINLSRVSQIKSYAIRIKSAVIPVGRLRYALPRYANKLPVKKSTTFNPYNTVLLLLNNSVTFH
jgi:hypothetical protein